MRILLLYNDTIHAWPLLRAADALCEIGIRLDPHEERSAQCFDRYFAGEWDCVLIHQELMSEQVVDCGKPVVILERIDGAQLGASRRWIHHVRGVLKGYVLDPPSLNNLYRGRVLAHALRARGVQGVKTCAVDGQPEQLAEADLAKIHAFYGFGAYEKQIDLLAITPDLIASRNTPVHFAGTVTYSGTEVETHRRAAARACRQIRGGIGHPGRVLRADDYRRTMLASRAVASPFGWGEACHRDYEAWILGCVLIKPECDYALGWPRCYVAGETYLPCRADFADLPEIVARVHRDWKHLEPMRRRCRVMAEEAASPTAIAARLKHLLEIIL